MVQHPSYPKRGRRQEDGNRAGTVPDWLLTFADLVTILLVFFILLVAFSLRDAVRITLVTGSMKDAFGKNPEMRKAAVLEKDGKPKREFVKNAALTPQDDYLTQFETTKRDDRSKQGQEANTFDIEETQIRTPRSHMLAAQSIRQALQSMPELTEVSQNIIFEETPEGLNIQLVDQDGRAMFPPGSKYPFKRTQKVLDVVAQHLRKLPNRIVITGHSTPNVSGSVNDSNWQLTADRANVTRSLLEEFGLSADKIAGIVGKADSEPLYPSDPYIASNRRVTIMLVNEAPPLPQGHSLN